jgi:hypothetical protein
MRTLCAIVACVLLGLGGCVEREWTLRTDPPGAVAYVSDVEVGRTPVTIDFTWYGDYEIVYELDGYETMVTHATLDPPWFQWPGIDFWSEIAPWTYHDRRETIHRLTPATAPNAESILQRAEELREETLDTTLDDE